MTNGCDMTFHEACVSILGQGVVDGIVADLGDHWLLPVAMSAATTDHDQRAVAVIRKQYESEKGT